MSEIKVGSKVVVTEEMAKIWVIYETNHETGHTKMNPTS